MSETFGGKNAIEDSEESIQERIQTLPPPLRPRWLTELENAESNQLAPLSRRLNLFIRERKRLLSHNAPPLLQGIHSIERREDKVNETLARIGEASERKDLFVGKGKAARVFRDPQDPNVCYKSIVNFEEYGICNAIGVEAQFLEDLQDLSVHGMRTPRLNAVIDLPTVKVISMEYLKAESINEIIIRNGAFPARFDVGRFETAFRQYVAAMHNRNIYHRDLHGGNILIADDGTPYIIDFGKSTFSITPESAYEAHDTFGRPMKPYPKDDDRLEELLRRTKLYMLGHPVEPLQ